MTTQNLNKIKAYVEAAKRQRAGNYAGAIKEYENALENLVDDPDKQLNQSLIYTHIAKCYAKIAINQIFSPLKTLNEVLSEKPDLYPSLALFQEFLEKAQASLIDDKSAFSKNVKASLISTKNYLSNNLTGKIKELLNASVQSVFEKKYIDTILQNIENHYQNFQEYIVGDFNNYKVYIMNTIINNGIDYINSLKSHDAQRAGYQLAADYIDETLQHFGDSALVKPAEFYFNKWYALAQIAMLSADNAEKIKIWETIIKEFNEVFEDNNRFQNYRSTQYAFAIFYAHKAQEELTKLAPSPSAKELHKKSAGNLKAKLTNQHENNRILPHELPERHRLTMLFALKTLFPDKPRTKVNYQESSMTDDEEEQEQKNETRKRKGKPASASTSSSDSDSSDDSDDEELDALLQKLADKTRKPASKHVSGSLAAQNEWYTDAKILTALDNRLRAEIDNSSVIVFGGIEMKDVFNEIESRRNQQLIASNNEKQVAQHFLIPVNVGQSHWIALSVDFREGLNRAPHVHYANPLSTNIPESIRKGFQRYPGTVIRGPEVMYQSNSYDCGPIVVALLEGLGKTKNFVAKAAINAGAIRTQDAQYCAVLSAPSAGSHIKKKPKL